MVRAGKTCGDFSAVDGIKSVANALKEEIRDALAPIEDAVHRIHRNMTTNVLQFLESFDRLPDPEKREAAAEILRRSLALEAPALDDQALVENAESLFLQLDEQEA